MHAGTARDLVARERRRRDAARARAAGPDVGATEVARAVIDEAREHVRRIRGRRSKVTARELRDAAALARECLQLAREAGLDAAGTEPPAPAGTEPAETAGALAAAAAEIAREPDPPPEPPAGEDGNHPGNGTPGNV